MNSKISMHGNKRMLFGVLFLASLIFLLWYFFHPLSPYNERTHYTAAFSVVGPIGSGSNVKIGGLPKGRILGMHKTDSCIYVTFEVVSTVSIPKDSRLTFTTVGFLGNHEICIHLGTSDTVYTSKDTIFNTLFDKGLNTALAEFNATLETTLALLDTIEKDSDRQKLDRVIRKGKNLVATANSDMESWKNEAKTLFENLSSSADKLQNSFEKLKSDAGALEGDCSELLSKLEQLTTSVENTKIQSKSVLEKLARNDNTAALVMKKGSEVSKQLDAIRASAQALIADVKKHGIKLNVDIF